MGGGDHRGSRWKVDVRGHHVFTCREGQGLSGGVALHARVRPSALENGADAEAWRCHRELVMWFEEEWSREIRGKADALRLQVQSSYLDSGCALRRSSRRRHGAPDAYKSLGLP